jgi:putative ABC transport system substrate-binding protein
MRRRIRRVALMVVACIVGGLPPAASQEPAKTPRVGLLSIGADSPRPPLWQPFFERTRELGYVEGRNITFERGFAAGREELLQRFADDFLRLNVDAIVVTGQREILAAKRATSSIPIVMFFNPDPVGMGVVASLARPGGNVTGLTTMDFAIYDKRIEILKEAIPGLARVALFVSPGNLTYKPDTAWSRNIVTAARSIGVDLKVVVAAAPDEIDRMVATAIASGVGAVVIAFDGQYVAHRKVIADIMVRHKMPAIFGVREHVLAGGLMAYSARSADLSGRAADYLDRVLKGAKPADLPVEQPTKFELVLNLKTAKALGLTIPPALLARADEVIE